jgi:hypothetical protein
MADVEKALAYAEFTPQGGHEGRLMYQRKRDGAHVTIGPARFLLSGAHEILVRLLTAEDRVKELEARVSRLQQELEIKDALIGQPIPDVETYTTTRIPPDNPMATVTMLPMEKGPSLRAVTVATSELVDIDQTYGEVIAIVQGLPCAVCGQSGQRVIGELKETAKGKQFISLAEFNYRCDPDCRDQTAPQESGLVNER